MKIVEVKMFFVITIFAGIAVALKWCTAETGLLVVIMQLLTSIVMMLSRIYRLLVLMAAMLPEIHDFIKQTADLRSEENSRENGKY